MRGSTLKNETLHLVAFDIPYPPNYGGVIDIFYKIVALKEIGINVILHSFLYGGKGHQSELEAICDKVYYYKRKVYKNPFYGELPYIVASRNSEELLVNLLKDHHPILFEGLHTTFYLNHSKLKNRFKMVRTHNVEHDYYSGLEEVESNFFKKYFFRIEAERLKRYEKILKHAQCVAAISPEDTAYYREKFKEVLYLPAFHGNEAVTSKTGRGKYILYHGNLAIGENHKAAMYLVNEVFPLLDLPCVIAGNQPLDQLEKAIENLPHVKLIKNIDSSEILDWVQDAQINILVTFQSTGIKLKLLNALHKGRHCVVNSMMVNNNGLEAACHVGNNAEELATLIKNCWNNEFGIEEIEWRKRVLSQQFSNQSNVQLIKKVLPTSALQKG